MPFKPVILWTDALIFVLVIAVLLFILRARAKEHLRAPWRRVARNRMAMVTLVILLAYVLVGLLDSLHFRPALPDTPSGQREYAVEVLSVLDVLVTPLRTQEEKTYSAPFATHLYAKETVERADGTQERIFPRLRYGGAHLTDLSARGEDIALTALRGFIEGVVAWAAFAALLAAWLARRGRVVYREMLQKIMRGATDIPWRAVLITSGVLIVLTAMAAELGVKYHLLGTDKVGQDVLYQAIKSIRTGLVIGTLTTLVMLPFAVLLGIMAGYFRGVVDDAVQYLYTTLSSIPGVLLIAAAILMLQVYIANHPEQFETVALRADVRLLFLCIILGITSWTGLCRLLRGETLKLREMDYIQAAQAFGVGHFKIITRHILPNVMHIVLITVVLDFSGLVLAEAVLSYVGVGVDPTTLSWGNMINAARLEMAREPMVWWPLLAAFVFMFALVLPANLFSDAVRDAFDPRLRKL
ncbi:MAG: ABC transporter permease [Pseudomonadota bacterium]